MKTYNELYEEYTNSLYSISLQMTDNEMLFIKVKLAALRFAMTNTNFTYHDCLVEVVERVSARIKTLESIYG